MELIGVSFMNIYDYIMVIRLDTFLSIVLVTLVIISKPLRYAAMILSQQYESI